MPAARMLGARAECGFLTCWIAQIPIVAATMGCLLVLGLAAMAYFLRTHMQDFSDRIKKRSGPPTSQSASWLVLQTCQPAACISGSLSTPRLKQHP